MTMDLYIVSLVPPIMMELMGRGYIASKPMGVLIRFTFMYEYEPIEKTVHIGGATHNAITINKVPTFIPDFNFRRAMSIAGFSHNITENGLPQMFRDDLNGCLQTVFWLNEFGIFAQDSDVGEYFCTTQRLEIIRFGYSQFQQVQSMYAVFLLVLVCQTMPRLFCNIPPWHF